MPKTPYLGLTLTAPSDTEKLFKTYRAELSGTQSDSNMNLIDEAIGKLRQTQASPFNLRGTVSNRTALNAIQNPVQNDTYMVTSEHCYYTWNGESWFQSSENDQQIETYVKEWLDDHPDATTTVVDKSISMKKLGVDVQSKLSELEPDSALSASSKHPVQNKVLYAAIEDVRQRQTSPYNFKGSCTEAALPSTAEVNDTWFVTDKGYRVTWTGDEYGWQQSSMDESKYTDELSALALASLQYQGAFAAGTDPDSLTAPGWWAVSVSAMEELTGISSQGIFLNFATPLGTVQTQQIVTISGDVLVRFRSGPFVPLNNATALARRAVLVQDSVTPDTVTDIGYYISPPLVTEDYTGIKEYALFVHSQTAAGADFIQVFITAGGRILTRRRGADDTFTEAYREAVGLMASSSSTAKTNANDCTGGLIHCFIPAGDGRHLRVSFVHGHWDAWQPGEGTAYKSGDHYRLDSGVLGRLQGGKWDPEKMLVVPGAWDGAVYTDYDAVNLAPNGTAFGSFHGWETFTRCIVKVDGVTLANLTPGDTLPDLDPAGCRCIEIFYWADLFLPATTTLVATIFKRYTITDEGIRAETRYKWATAGSRAMYSAMGCFSRALTDRAVCDYDYTLYDISDGAETPITTSANNKQGVSWCAELGTESDALCEIQVEPPVGMYIQNNLNSDYNKVYFNRAGQVVAGDTWTAKAVFSFGGRKSVASGSPSLVM